MGYERIIRNANLEAQYSAENFVNPSAFDNSEFDGKAYVFLNGGFVQAIVFAEYPAYTESDALDEAADSGKLGDPLTPEELKEYETGEYTDVGNEHSPKRKVKVEVEGVQTEVEIHGGWPEYDSRVVNLGNASEPYDQEGWDLWVVPGKVFAEDPALMRPERVMTRLEESLERANRAYQAVTDVSSPEWMAAYRAVREAEDTITHARLTIAR